MSKKKRFASLIREIFLVEKIMARSAINKIRAALKQSGFVYKSVTDLSGEYAIAGDFEYSILLGGGKWFYVSGKLDSLGQATKVNIKYVEEL